MRLSITPAATEVSDVKPLSSASLTLPLIWPVKANAPQLSSIQNMNDDAKSTNGSTKAPDHETAF